jgi:DNA adenine methylase
VKPPFTYFGGKTRIASQIAAMLPPHEHYVEPFAGSLAVLLAKPRSMMETVNDLDGDLVAFWRVLRERPAELEHACALTPHSRAEHADAIRLAEAPDDLERARRVWIRLTQGRSGQLHHLTGWRHYQDPRGSNSPMPGYLASYVRRICPAAERITGVSLECLPASEIIRRYGQHESVLIYADPPYLEETRSSAGRGPSYEHEMRTGDEHRELATALLEARAAVVLSGYDSPLYAGLYDGWHRTDFPAFTGNSHDGTARRTEVLWSNRPFPQGSLFDSLEAG